MSTPFQAITTGDKSISERVSAPLRAVKSDFQQRRKTAEATYDVLNIDYTGLPNNQVQMAQAWGDSVRENLIEGYRTNNQELIREAKDQGRRLTSYITAMQQDYTIGRNSIKRAEEKQYQGLSNSKEEIQSEFKNRYNQDIGFEVDERGYPKGIVIDGNPVGIGEFTNALRDNPFMVVDQVDFGSGYQAATTAQRHLGDVAVLGSVDQVRTKGAEYAKKDLENQMVSNEDLAVLYAVKNKLISDINNPSEADVIKIQEIANDPKRLEDAKNLYVNDYREYLVNTYNTQEKARAKQERITQERVAAQGILALDPVVENVGGENLAVYYTNVDGVAFDIKGNERVTSVGIDESGNIKYVEVAVPNPEYIQGYSDEEPRYITKEYANNELTEEIAQLVKNRIEIKAPKQIKGWSRFTDKAKKAIKSAPNESQAIDILSQPAIEYGPQQFTQD
jgi:hypothetical protein